MAAAEQLTKHDREIAAIRKLVHQGMKMLVKSEDEHKAFRKDLRALRDPQQETDRPLQLLIQSLRGGTNGHAKRKVE
jgi:hypothetical protein